MSTFTMEQLKEALKGIGIDVEEFDDEQARIKYGGFDIAFIDLKDCIIECDIRVDGAPGSEIDPAEAWEKLDELRSVWETAGFTVNDHGSKGTHYYKCDPETKYCNITYDVRQSFSTLEEAVRILSWTRNAEQST